MRAGQLSVQIGGELVGEDRAECRDTDAAADLSEQGDA